MRAILHSDVRVTGNVLVDSSLGLRYTLTPDAAWLVDQLVREQQLSRLVPKVARLRHIGQSEAKQAVYALLGQLGAFGVVRIVWEQSVGLGLRLRFRWVWCCRQPATVVGCTRALWRAYGWIFGSIQLGFMSAYLYFGLDMPAALVALPALVAATLGFHEAGHIIVARYCRVRLVLLARPGYFSVLYKRPRAAVARWIAFGGPSLAVIASLAFAAVYSQTHIINVCLIVAAVLHGASLLPIFADGKTLWRRSW